MKKKIAFVGTLAMVLALTSCNGMLSSLVSSNSSLESSRSESTDSLSSPSVDSSSTQSASSSETIDSSKDDTPKSKVAVFAVNDMHGYLKQSDSAPGILNLEASIHDDPHYLPDASIIVSSGDMWQGSYESGFDKGLSTTELMNEFPFAAMTLGNHEFDWGMNQILSNEKVANFPFLGANVIDKSTGKRAEGIQDHAVLAVGGNKIGMVGAIGAGLEGTIKDEYIQPYDLSSDLSLLQNAYQACIDEGAELVFLSVHDDEDSDYVNAIQASSIPFVGIFGGHSHRFQLDRSGIPYVQGGSNSKGYSYMTFDMDAKALTDIDYAYVQTHSDAASVNPALTEKLNDVLAKIPSASFGEITGYWDKKTTANFVLRALAFAAARLKPEKNYTTDNLLAVHNQGGIRGDYGNHSGIDPFTMDDIQKVSPFDNKVILFHDRSLDANQVGSHNRNNYVYPDSPVMSKTYDVVGIDYLSDQYSSMWSRTNSEILQDPTRGGDYIVYNAIADYAESLAEREIVIDPKDYR